MVAHMKVHADMGTAGGRTNRAASYWNVDCKFASAEVRGGSYTGRASIGAKR